MRRALHIAATATTVAAAPAMAQPEEFVYYYFDQPQTILLDDQHLIAHVDSANPEDLENVWGNMGSVAAIEEWLASGWYLVTLTEALDSTSLSGVADELLDETASTFVSPLFTDTAGRSIALDRTVFIGFADKGTAEGRLAALDIGVVEESDYSHMPGVYRLTAHSRNGFTLLEQVNNIAPKYAESENIGVSFAQTNMIYTVLSSGCLPAGELYGGDAWGLENTGQLSRTGQPGLPDFDMNAGVAFCFTDGDPSVRVAVLDNGVDFSHPDMATHAFIGADTAPPDSTLPPPTTGLPGEPQNSCDRHGTTVAGCIAAEDNFHGTIGIAPGATIVSIRVASTQATYQGVCSDVLAATTTSIVDGLEFARVNGVQITTCSLGLALDPCIAAKYAETREGGMLHFASAGNAAGAVGFPARVPAVIAVGAADRFGNRADFSSYGNALDFLAPGVEITTTDRSDALGVCAASQQPNTWFGITDPADCRHDNWVWVDGTSYASPYAAGVAALILSFDPTAALDADQVEAVMRLSSLDMPLDGSQPGFDPDHGWGLTRAGDALLLLYRCENSPTSLTGEVDCNNNQILDACEIIGDPSLDLDRNSVLDTCQGSACPCELDGIAGVSVFDLLAYLDFWFPSSPLAERTGDAVVDIFDLLDYLDCWFPASAGGSCP